MSSSNHSVKKNFEKEKYPDKSLLDDTLNSDNLSLIKTGFKINKIKMKDGSNGKLMWETSSYDLNNSECKEYLPKEILDCSVVTREINFSSKEKIYDLELVQNFYLMGELIETNNFFFGFVIPDSTNNWEQIVEARPKEEMLPYTILSGNLVVEVLFLSKGETIVRNRTIVFYV